MLIYLSFDLLSDCAHYHVRLIERSITFLKGERMNTAGKKSFTRNTLLGAAVVAALAFAPATMASAAPADTTIPTVTVKGESIVKNGIYRSLSLKLIDAGKIDKVSINGTVKDLVDNVYSDVNGIKPGAFGAIQGVNTIIVYDVAGNATPPYTYVLDTAAPSVTSSNQVYQTKEGGRIAVTLNFSEDIDVSSLPQGWYGSGTSFTKVFYSTKDVTVPFTDIAGNAGSYTFTVDATPATVVDIQQVPQSGRIAVTLTFSEPVVASSLPQGWYGSGVSYTKVYFNNKPATATFTDLFGNPGSYSFTPAAF